MANLLGQNIGTNYKGILNLNTLNGNLSGTLQAVTDGDGNASPLRLSTTEVLVNSKLTVNNTLEGTVSGRMNIVAQYDLAIVSGNSASGIGGVFIGGSSVTPTARLHVRGDGTNPIARFENSAGTLAVSISNAGQLAWAGGDYFELTTSGRNLFTANILSFLGTWVNAGSYVWGFLPTNSISATSGTHGFLNIGNSSFAAAAGSANFRPLNIAYTINNSGAQTGTATGIFLNATETALNGMTHNLMDLQVGGASRFRISSGASLTVVGAYEMRWSTYGSYIYHGGTGFDILTGIGSIMLSPNNSLVTFLGRTNAFPALKRNAAALDVRLADDSGFATINASSFTIGGTSTSLVANALNLAGFNVMFYSSRIYIDNDNKGVAINNNLAIGNGNVATNSSSVLECISTTKGFLPPRMTTAERDLIASPATGLVIYNTSTNVLNFYNGTAWGAV